MTLRTLTSSECQTVVSFELTSRLPLHSGHCTYSHGRSTALQADSPLHAYERNLDERVGVYHATSDPNTRPGPHIDEVEGGINLRALQASSNARIDNITRRHLQQHAAWRTSRLAQEV
jgi:hypothetical protein